MESQLQQGLHGAYMQLLNDVKFKRAFGGVLSVAYLFLNDFYCQGKVADIMNFTVQIFTTPSIVLALEPGSTPEPPVPMQPLITSAEGGIPRINGIPIWMQQTGSCTPKNF